jgi:hypothetical protein
MVSRAMMQEIAKFVRACTRGIAKVSTRLSTHSGVLECSAMSNGK